MTTVVIERGNKAVVICENSPGRFDARLWVNARPGLPQATATLVCWKGKTLAGAKRWAEKALNL